MGGWPAGSKAPRSWKRKSCGTPRASNRMGTMSVSAHEAAKPAKGFRLDLKTAGPLLALILLVILGYSLNPAFLNEGNITNILTRSAFIGIIAVGATFVIIAGGIDLSVGSMAAFISGIMIIVMNKAAGSMGTGWNVVLLGMGVSVAVGLLAGLLNGLVTTKGKIEPFIVTLGTMGIYRSLVTYLADGGTLSLNFGIRGTYRPVYYDSLWFIPYPVLIFVIVALLGGLLLNKTRFGRYCLATGSNENVARY